MAYQMLLDAAERYAASAPPPQPLGEKAARMYEARIRGYREAMTALHDLKGSPPAEPVTEQSVRTYLEYRARCEHCSMSTLKADLSALRRYIGDQGQPDPTRTYAFKAFMEGLALV
jgi:hypothetical protein